MCGTCPLDAGGSPSATVFVPAAVKGKGLKISREARRQLSGPELEVVERVVEAVLVEVDRLCARKGIGEPK